jgi:hypothetical protein
MTLKLGERKKREGMGAVRTGGMASFYRGVEGRRWPTSKGGGNGHR